MPKNPHSLNLFKNLNKVGHWPTLVAAFLYFDVSFMVWVSLGPLMTYITKDMQLPAEDKLTLVAVPALSGAFFRIPLGLIADAIGAKKTSVLVQIIVIISVFLVYQFGFSSERNIVLFGLILGVAGASFAVALPQVGRWYPPDYQGLVMGIAGAGNMGVVIDALCAPWIAEKYGWQTVYGLLLILLFMVLLLYAAIAEDCPTSKKNTNLMHYASIITHPDCRWFMFFYFITAGGFIGLSSSLPLYFTIQFHESGVIAGLLSAFSVAFGSCVRPVGGYFADKFGGIKVLSILDSTSKRDRFE